MVNYMNNTPLPFRALLLRSSRLFTDRINTVLQGYDLNYSLWTVLYVVNNLGTCSQIEIAQALKISQPAVTKRIANLESSNFITFIPSENKREKIVTLTAKGKQCFIDGEKEIQQLEELYSEGLSSAQIEQAKSILYIFLQNLQQGD